MKNKGMTLIELLVVIVLVAIIALIVVPIVGNTVEDVKKKTAVTNTDKLVKTVIDYYETEVMKNEQFTGVVFECDGEKCFDESDSSNKLSFSGEVPKGHVAINEYGEVKQADFMFSKYVCSMIDDKITCKKPDLIITSIDEFNTFLKSADGYSGKLVVLTSDIDYYEQTYTPSSKIFNGEFNGLGYNVSNITYEGADFHGIFCIIDNATVKSLNVKDSTFTITGALNDIGVVIGKSQNNSNIYNCSSINSTIKTSSQSTQIGGIIGRTTSTVVDGCTSLGLKIIGSMDYANDNRAGIVAQAYDGSKIYNCSVSNSYIEGSANIGGLVGDSRAEIYNSYTKDVILYGNGNVGGLVGFVGSSTNDLTINNSYVEYSSSNETIITEKIALNNPTLEDGIDSDLTGNINIKTENASTGGLIGEAGANITVNNSYVKNVDFGGITSDISGNSGNLIGVIQSGANVELNNSYALAIKTSYLGQINSTTTKNTIIFDHDDQILYQSGDVTSISGWKKSLDDNIWNTTSSKYPLLYKLDKNGNPTPYLLGGQE